MIETLDDNKVVYIAGAIPRVAFSAALGWGIVEELEAPGEFGVGRYQIGGKVVYAMCAHHPSSGITARGNGSKTRALERDLAVIRAVAEVSGNGFEVRDGELDAAIAKRVTAEVIAWQEGAKEAQGYLDIVMGQHGWWPEELRVLRLVNFADPYFLDAIKWLHEKKSVSKEQILKLLSVSGVATAIARDGFKEPIKWLHEKKSVSMEQILKILLVRGVATPIVRDGFKESIKWLHEKKSVSMEQILKLLLVRGVATAIARDSFKESIEWLQYEKSVPMEQILKLFSVERAATAIVRDGFKESIEWLQYEKSVSMEQILKLLSVPGVARTLQCPRSLEGVGLLVEERGHECAVTELRRNQQNLFLYIEKAEFAEEAKPRAKWEAKRKKAELEAKRRAEFSRLNQDDVIAGCDPSKLAATRSYIEGLIDGVVTKKEVVAVLRELGVSMTYISSKASTVERLKGHYKRRYGW